MWLTLAILQAAFVKGTPGPGNARRLRSLRLPDVSRFWDMEGSCSNDSTLGTRPSVLNGVLNHFCRALSRQQGCIGVMVEQFLSYQSNDLTAFLQVDVKDGRHDMYNGFLEICPKAYPVESIWLNESKSGIQGTVFICPRTTLVVSLVKPGMLNSLLTSSLITGTVAEKEAVQAFVSSKSNEQNWCGPFALPAEGDVTTGFGLQRYYNGVFADGYYYSYHVRAFKSSDVKHSFCPRLQLRIIVMKGATCKLTISGLFVHAAITIEV